MALRPSADGASEVVAGFATVYRFFAYSRASGGEGGGSDSRLRLSQLLVAQPHQRQGVATHLLEACRSLALARGSVDLTVEDPTDELQRLRELADTRAARGMPSVVRAAPAAVASAGAPGKEAGARRAALEPPPAAVEALRLQLRLCRPQARLVWETLLFLAARAAQVPPGGEAAKACRALLEARLRGGEGGGRGGGGGGAVAPRKFLVDLEKEGEAGEEEEEGPDSGFPPITPCFLMARGACGGTGRAKAPVVEEVGEEAAARLARDLGELMGLEMARLTSLATKLLSETP